MERDKLCLKRETGNKLLAFNLKRSLDEMIQFCENVGGKVAVARDEERQAKKKENREALIAQQRLEERIRRSERQETSGQE